MCTHTYALHFRALWFCFQSCSTLWKQAVSEARMIEQFSKIISQTKSSVRQHSTKQSINYLLQSLPLTSETTRNCPTFNGTWGHCRGSNLQTGACRGGNSSPQSHSWEADQNSNSHLSDSLMCDVPICMGSEWTYVFWSRLLEIKHVSSKLKHL